MKVRWLFTRGGEGSRRTHFLELPFQIQFLDRLVGFFERHGVIWSMEEIDSDLEENYRLAQFIKRNFRCIR